MIIEPKLAAHYNHFIAFSLLCPYFITDMIKNLELRLLVLRIEFGHAQISVPKISALVSKAACINPCSHSFGYIIFKQ